MSKPLRADGRVAGDQAQRRASKQWLQPARLREGVSIGQVDDDEVSGSHFVRWWDSSPESCIDRGLQPAA